jgi:hypothetical protein
MIFDSLFDWTILLPAIWHNVLRKPCLAIVETLMYIMIGLNYVLAALLLPGRLVMHWGGLSNEFFANFLAYLIILICGRIFYCLFPSCGRVLWFLRSPGLVSYQVYRGQFDKVLVLHNKPVEGHTHGVEARNRSSAVTFMETFAQVCGLQYYPIGLSRADVRHGFEGVKVVRHLKDLVVEPRGFVRAEGRLICMVDEDFKRDDLETFLACQKGPVLLYTFIPDTVCSGDGEATFTFDKYSNLNMTVSGGASYRHPLWNWGGDSMFARTFDWATLTGIRSTQYLIDRKYVGPNRYLVLLTPIASWGMMGTLLAETFRHNNLRRLVVAHGEFLRLNIQRWDGLYVSTARVGSFAHCTTLKSVDDVIQASARISKVGINLPSVRGIKGVPDAAAAAVIVDYHLATTPTPVDFVFPVKLAVRGYQQLENYQPGAKPSMNAFMSPLYHGCFAPELTVGNEKWCITDRIEKPQIDSSQRVSRNTAFIKQLTRRCMADFLKEMIPEPHQAAPVDMDEVMRRQARPTQRRLIWEAFTLFSPLRIIKMFLKHEAYGGYKAPRAISTVNSLDKAQYSRFMYVVAELLKQQKWYAFGKTPKQTAQAVADICVQALHHVTNSDYDKYDGHVSEEEREFERMFVMRLFRPEYHAELDDLLRSQFGLKGISTLGIIYQMLYSRGSGSAETSGYNSFGSAFKHYLAFRMTLRGSQFMTHREAWDAMGLYGGDDGITADIDGQALEKASSAMGHNVVALEIPRGGLGVKFLARYYSDNVWEGDVNSCCDLSRQLAKFHTTVMLPSNVSPMVKLLEKARAYYLTDKNTPIIGHFVQSVLAAAEREPLLKTRADELSHITQVIVPWHSRVAVEDQYPNEYGHWMGELMMKHMPGIDVARFVRWIADCDTVEKHMHPPLIMDYHIPEVKVAMVDNGDVHEPALPEPHSPVYVPTSPMAQKMIAEGRVPDSPQPYSPTVPPPPVESKGAFDKEVKEIEEKRQRRPRPNLTVAVPKRAVNRQRRAAMRPAAKPAVKPSAPRQEYRPVVKARG